MSSSLAVIEIGLAPDFHLGPVTVAWHGLTIVIGIAVGGLLAGRWCRERGLPTEPLFDIAALLTLGAVVGSRLFYLAERDPASLLDPGSLFATRGFTFDGGLILAGLLLVVYLRRSQKTVLYLDAVAAGLPLGLALGRVGDVINGEHFGPRSDSLLAVRNSHPEALTPNGAFAYENGGLYEVLLAAVVFSVVWPQRHRFKTPGILAWTVFGTYSAGRFLVFFLRSDSPVLALGLDNGQWTSIVLVVVSVGGVLLTRRYASRRPLLTPT